MEYTGSIQARKMNLLRSSSVQHWHEKVSIHSEVALQQTQICGDICCPTPLPKPDSFGMIMHILLRDPCSKSSKHAVKV
jgi:hypothetical protein